MKRLCVIFVLLAVLLALPVVALDVQYVRSTALNPPSPTNDLDVGDVDGDGDLDVLYSSVFMINNGHGIFTPRAHGACGVMFRLADLDADGDLDIAGLSYTSLYILLNDGAGNFTSLPVQYGFHANGYNLEIAVADLNGDGAPDIINNAGALYINHGNGTFVDEAVQRGLVGIFDGQGEGRTDVAVLDANRDGLNDLFFPMAGPLGHALYIQHPGGTFVDETAARLPGLGYLPFYDGLDAVDLNGDGAMDIASNSYQGLKLLENDGTGVFTERMRSYFPGGSPESYPAAWAVKDLNFDIRPDLVMLGTQLSRIYFGGTQVPFLTSYPIPPAALTNAGTSYSSVIHLVDLNDDGWDEILFRTGGSGSGAVQYFVNQLSTGQAVVRMALTPELGLALQTTFVGPAELGPETYSWSLFRSGETVPAYTLSGQIAPLDGSATMAPGGEKVAPGMYRTELKVTDSFGRRLAWATYDLAVPRDYYDVYLECGTERQTLTEQLAQSEADRQALQVQLDGCEANRTALTAQLAECAAARQALADQLAQSEAARAALQRDAAFTQAGLQEIQRLAALPPGQRHSTFQPQGSQAAAIAQIIALLLPGSH